MARKKKPENATEEILEQSETIEASAAEPEELETAAEKTVVYIGPSIPRSALRNGEILRGTEEALAEFIAGKAEQYPEIKHLLVPPEKLSDVRKKMETGKSVLNKYYSDMADKARR